MGTVPESIEDYYGPQPNYDYTWKGIPIFDGRLMVNTLGMYNLKSMSKHSLA